MQTVGIPANQCVPNLAYGATWIANGQLAVQKLRAALKAALVRFNVQERVSLRH
jgi:hypothetical protein